MTSTDSTSILNSGRKEGAVRGLDLECEYLLRDERAFLKALLDEPGGFAARSKAEARVALLSSVIDGWDALRTVGSPTNESQLNDVRKLDEEGGSE